MDQPTEEHHLKDLGSTEDVEPGDTGPVQDGPPADASPETLTGDLGLEGSADSPTGDDRFTGGSH